MTAKRNEEPSPLEHLVELIVGDRFPTEFEYLRWLESEEQRNDHESYMEFNSKQQEFLKCLVLQSDQNQGKAKEKGTTLVGDVNHTKSLIHKIMEESKKSIDEDQVVKLDGEDPAQEDRDHPKPDAKMVDEEKKSNEDKTEDKDAEDVDETMKEMAEKLEKQEKYVEELKLKYGSKRPTEHQYLIKYKALSYRRSRWINESEFNVLSFQCQQKLNRYKIKKRKELAQGLFN